MTTPAPSYDVRGTFEVQDDQAIGWCWSQQRPKEALRVEVLSDGQVIASGVAARLVLDLVRPGITDGYHGYLLILPKELTTTAILEAREAGTGKVFARRLPKTLTDVIAWQRRVAELGGEVVRLHDKLSQAGSVEARWSTAWGAGGALLNRRPMKTRQHGLTDLALRQVAQPRWTIILDLPRARSATAAAAEATARWELTQLAPLLSLARAELVAVDDGRAAGFLAGVKGLRYAAVPRGAGDVARLTAGLGMAEGIYVAIFAPLRQLTAPLPSPRSAPATLRGRAALLAEPPAGSIVVGGGVAAAIRGARLYDLMPLVERVEAETGLLMLTPRAVYERVGALDPKMDDGADLALVDFALRARGSEVVARVLEGTPPLRSFSPGRDLAMARRTFLRRWRIISHS